MSTIRPGLPIPVPASQTPAISPARAELMRMMGLTTPVQTAAAQPAAPQAATPRTPVPTQVRIEPMAPADSNAPVRPGSFLDIRV